MLGKHGALMGQGGRNRWGNAGRLAVAATLLLLLLSSHAEAKKSAFERACGHFPCSVEDSGAADVENTQIENDFEGFRSQVDYLSKILSELKSIRADVTVLLGEKLQEAFSRARRIAMNDTQAMVQQLKKLEAYQNDSYTKDTMLGDRMKAAMQTTMPPPTEQFLCNQISACQAPVAMGQFSRIVSRMIADGIALRYRDASDDGAGPAYARDQLANKQERGYFNKLDGADQSLASPTTGSDSGLADADISVNSLALDAVLQVPPMKKMTKTFPSGRSMEFIAPDVNAGSTAPNDVAEKKAWIAAVDYCTRLAGPRPTPPTGKELDTPDGRVKRAQWEHCASLQNDFVQLCSDRVGMLSKPDCSNDDYKNICEAALQGCNAARDAQMSLPSGLRDCASGANQYQMEQLCNSMCESSRRYQAGATVGQRHDEMMADIAMCQLSSNIWQKRIALQEEVFKQAIDAMKNLDSCWKATQ